MNERRVLIALLLLAAGAAVYVWGWPGGEPDKPVPPEKSDAAERTKANPFPATDK